MNGNKVFISYSHDTPEHSRLVLQLANALRSQGVDAELDQYHVRPSYGWPRWCEEHLRPENSAFVLAICTHTYRQRVECKTAADEGRGVFWEGGIIYSYLYEEKGNNRFIPVLLPGAQENDIPRLLRDDTRYRLEAFDLNDPGYQTLYRELTGQPAVIKPDLGDVVPLPLDAQSAVNPLAPLPARKVLSRFIQTDISRIDKYAPDKLIGREEEVALLDAAWDQVVRGEPGRPRVLTFVALGGEGKTALVAKWAAELAGNDWPGCETVFAWSFYSQGTRDQAAASSDIFMKEALLFFGDPDTAESAEGPFEKGKRLARLVGGKKALLILDGLEPLQYAPTSPTPGELKDQGICALLKGLAASSNGLCIVTTRYSIPDLKTFRQTTAPEIILTRLSTEAGVALLKNLGVKGNDKELVKLVEEVKGHALSLNLIGSFLRDAHAGDIRRRDLIKLEEADAEEQGGHAFHVMDAYVRWFEQGGKNAKDKTRGQQALAILRLLGLFDRPATADCLNALWSGDVITGLTEPLIGISETQRNLALTRLEAARLLTVHRDTAGTLLCLDAHPLLREYFARNLAGNHPKAWQAAHKQLFEHLCTTKEGDHPTLESLQPLYQAVAHGCRAGLQQEACEKVYRDRILHGTGSDGFYSLKKLGAFGSDLGAVACFFETPWRSVSSALTEADQAWLLNQAAFSLRALGRLTEALECMRANLKIRIEREEWQHAPSSASNLSELELTLGDVAGAVADAEQSVVYADRSGDTFMRIINRTIHADALHQAGRRAEAEALFRQAEQMQAEDQPEYPLLYSLQGFRYCDLLLAGVEREAGKGRQRTEGRRQRAELIEKCRSVAKRAAQALKWEEGMHGAPLLDFALHHLTLSRAALYEAILGKSEIQNARSEIEMAVSGLRRAGTQHHLPRGLLTRAWLRSLTGPHTGPENTQSDLDEAWEIAQHSPMPLHMADIHLYRARLFFRESAYPWDSPQADLAKARRLIEKQGYWRRKEELEDAEAAIL